LTPAALNVSKIRTIANVSNRQYSSIACRNRASASGSSSAHMS
jgi:hypothetical protein